MLIFSLQNQIITKKRRRKQVTLELEEGWSEAAWSEVIDGGRGRRLWRNTTGAMESLSSSNLCFYVDDCLGNNENWLFLSWYVPILHSRIRDRINTFLRTESKVWTESNFLEDVSNMPIEFFGPSLPFGPN